MDYSDPERNSFMYRMEGIDDDWIESGNRHYASYTKIDPGHYEFIVKGTNSDEIWSSNEARINLIIAPPFWQKWWFRVCIIVIIILLLYSLHLYRVNKIREIERLRIRIASDLHDDIGSALTRISVHSQQILTSREDEKIRMSSNKINDLSREVISTMSDVVWSIDARNDTLSDLLTRMQDFTHNALSEKDIRVSFEQIGMDSGRHIPVLERQNIFYIFKEAINNIVKHSEATEVKISIQNIDSHFKMRIADNGKGYDTEKIRRGNGIRNMNMRAERIGATIEIQSNSGVVIKLKMNRL